MTGADAVPALREALSREGKGRGQVNIVGLDAAREVELKLPGGWAVTARGRAAIKALPLTLVAARPIDEAISTAGGVRFEALDDALMLRELPGARLFLKSSGLNDSETAGQIRATFASHGVSPDRIELNDERLSVADHLALYSRIDIALDPFPYTGTTATCETLWMGVPVVTLAGQTHVSRVGASLLTHLGAPEWIAGTPDEYLAIGHNLASDPPRLAVIRGALRERMRQSPLCDAARFTRDLESAFRKMWESWCASRSREGPQPLRRP